MNIIHANVSGDNIGWGSIPRRGQTATRPRCIRNQQLCVHYVLCTLSTAQCSVCAQCAAHQRLWSLGCGNELWIVSSAILSCAFCKINSLMCAPCNARCANNIGDRKIPFFHLGKCCSSTFWNILCHWIYITNGFTALFLILSFCFKSSNHPNVLVRRGGERRFEVGLSCTAFRRQHCTWQHCTVILCSLKRTMMLVDTIAVTTAKNGGRGEDVSF